MEKIFDKAFIDTLLAQAAENPRKRQNHDLRNSAADTSQRMMNALLPETQVEILYEEIPGADGQPGYREVSRTLLSPAEGSHGMQVPAGAWHSIEVLEPSIIFEAKDGAYKG